MVNSLNSTILRIYILNGEEMFRGKIQWFYQAEGQADMFRSSGSRNSAHKNLQV